MTSGKQFLERASSYRAVDRKTSERTTQDRGGMTDSERFLACMSYQSVDRVPFHYWGPWDETEERWKAEGYDPDKFDLQMGADQVQLPATWFFPNPPFEARIIEEDEEHVLYLNYEGIVMREMKDNRTSSMPQFVRFPVETREDFRRFWKERMQPDLTKRIGPDWKEELRTMRSKPFPLIVWADRWGGFFGPLRNLLGVENLCTLFYDDPSFAEEMMDADADFIIAMMGQILDVVTVDAFAYWEDMAYNTAPLLSPEMARRYMLPRYKRVNEFLFGRGVKFIGLDSDGKIDSLIPVWMDAGINYLFPFEAQSGMDVVKVRKTYGKDLRILGGIDKRAVARGPEAIDIELARVRPLMSEGGYIPHADHCFPPDVSFENYCYFMSRLETLCREVAAKG